MQRKIDPEYFLELDLEAKDPVKKLQPVWKNNRQKIFLQATDACSDLLENRLEAIFLIGALADSSDHEAKELLLGIINDPFEDPLVLDAAQDAFDVLMT